MKYDQALTSEVKFLPDQLSGVYFVLLEPYQQGNHLSLLLLCCCFNGVSLPLSCLSEVHLPPGSNPPPDGVKASPVSCPVERSKPILLRFVNQHPRILQKQQDTCRGSVLTGIQKGSLSATALLVDVNARVGQEKGDKGAITVAGSMKGGVAMNLVVLPVDVDGWAAFEDLLYFIHPSISNCVPQMFFHFFVLSFFSLTTNNGVGVENEN